ncbi:hypothetical protein [Azospirillum endophyticum]
MRFGHDQNVVDRPTRVNRWAHAMRIRIDSLLPKNIHETCG